MPKAEREMRTTSVTQLLLLKRAKSLIEAPKRDDLDSLSRKLRAAFPEYQRQPKQDFLQRLDRLFFADVEIQKEKTEATTKLDAPSEEELGTCSEGGSATDDSSLNSEADSDAVEEAIAEYIASEGTERVNRGLRELYSIGTRGSDTAQPTAPPESQHQKKRTNQQDGRKQERETDGIPAKRKKLVPRADPVSSKKVANRRSEGPSQNRSSSPVHLSLTTSFMTAPRKLQYSDLGGLEDVVGEIKELVEYPLKHPEVYDWLGVEPPRGVLLHGPPGCGKTALAHAIAHECQVPFFRISAPEIISGMSGESEAKIRTLFQEALNSVPSIIFIDEIDAIAAKRENAQREMERRIVAQMLTCMDDLSSPSAEKDLPNTIIDSDAPSGSHMNGALTEGRVQNRHVIVLGATNRPDVLDPALRRAGRFDREIALGIPTEASRAKILTVMCAKLKLEGTFDFSFIARKTPGFVGADLEALTREAAAIAVTRIFTELQSQHSSEMSSTADALPRFGAGALTSEELMGLRITMGDFIEALKKVQPSLGREGFTTKPDVTWDDIGSLRDIREELSFSICQPILHPERFERMGLSLASGVLLYGAPGCGKTLVAKAVANEAGTNFISIKGPELLNKYVGESERAVRQLFARARAAKPCVLFFDEMDALAPKRGTDNNQAAERLVNQLLTEMDGIDGREGVFLIAATNRPDIIDAALLRPGRLDKMLYVPLPDASGRVSILQTLTRKSPISPDVDFEAVGRDPRCHGLSGADLASLVREACIRALKESIAEGDERRTTGNEILQRHFEEAMDVVKPSVSEIDAAAYECMQASLRKSRSHVQP